MSGVYYFPRYTQRENFITNNTLLLLSRLYDLNRHRFKRFVASFLGEEAPDLPESLGLQIHQQASTASSVLDGYLAQQGLRIGVETKLAGDGFDIDQLRRHLTNFGDGARAYLILLSPDTARLERTAWATLTQEATKRNVVVVAKSFEDLIQSVRSALADHDEELHLLIDDYEAFCSESEILPTDRWTMFAPPCGTSFEINRDFALYFCPAEWRRRRARYLGIYLNKAIRLVGTIAKVIECEIDDGRIVNVHSDDGRPTALTDSDTARILGASKAAQDALGWDLSPRTKYFLSERLFPTQFAKTSAGGILGHRYFDLRRYVRPPIPSNLEELAGNLNGMTWE